MWLLFPFYLLLLMGFYFAYLNYLSVPVLRVLYEIYVLVFHWIVNITLGNGHKITVLLFITIITETISHPTKVVTVTCVATCFLVFPILKWHIFVPVFHQISLTKWRSTTNCRSRLRRGATPRCCFLPVQLNNPNKIEGLPRRCWTPQRTSSSGI